MSTLIIRPLKLSDLEDVRLFCDQTIGRNYYSTSELQDCFKRSLHSDVMCSFLLIEKSDDAQHIVGIRLTYPPGQWSQGKGAHLHTDLWKTQLHETAYFQSLFLARHIQGQGWGQKLSLASIEALKRIGAKAIVTHSWRESPNNSSVRYLQKLGFTTIAVHPQYWKDVDYECVRDGKPCLCTAEEMILYIGDV